MIAELWAHFPGRCAVSAAATLISTLLWWLWPQQWSRRAQLALLFLLALSARCLFLCLPASDDVQRYIWEGQLVLEGYSPYATTADDPVYDLRRDEHWQLMNHKDCRTAYPPLAMLLCAAVQAAGLEELGFKLAAGLADLALILLLAWRLPGLRWVALYALNPVPLISYVGEGHFDSFMVLFMVAAVLLLHHPRLAWTLLALGIGIKFMALLLLPVLWKSTPRGQRMGCVAWAAVALAVPALPFLATLMNLLEGVVSFGTQTSSNATLHWLLELVTSSKPLASLLCGLVFCAISVRLFRLHLEPASYAQALFTALLLCAPTVTYWYPAWALPFAVMRPHPALWILSATDIFYYAAWQEQQLTGVWWLPRWAWAALWLPYLLALLRGVKRT